LENIPNGHFATVKPLATDSSAPVTNQESVLQKFRHAFVAGFGAYLVSAAIGGLLFYVSHLFFEQILTFKWRISGELVVDLTCLLLCVIWPRQIAYLGQLALGLMLTEIFVQNNIQEHGTFSIPIFALTGLCLGAYFVAEAFEISVTQLRAKESDRIPSSDAKFLLEIEANHHVFYEAREWLVIALVICLTLASDFKELHVGRSLSFPRGFVTVVYSLLFTTVLVIWTAQSPGKTLALEDPVALLRFCRFLWKPLLVMGTIMKEAQLFRPAEPMMQLIGALPGLRGGPRLKPSQEAYYHTSIKRYGYALHYLQDEIFINRDGSGQFRQTGLFYVVCGQKTEFMRWFSFLTDMAANASDEPEVAVLTRTFLVPDFDERLPLSLVQELDDIANGKPLKADSGAIEIDFGLTNRAEWERNDDGTFNRKRLNVVLESPLALPEDLGRHQAVAISFDISLSIGPNFAMPDPLTKQKTSSFNFRKLEVPCRSYRTIVHLVEVNDVQFGPVSGNAYLGKTLQPSEHERMEICRGYPKPFSSISVRYPMPGVEYKLTWEIWPNP
jgi:hypothetical protein